jgi:hypothetical protein
MTGCQTCGGFGNRHDPIAPPSPGRHRWCVATVRPRPYRPSRLWLGLMTAAVTGIVAGTVAAGHAAAPKVAADERLALTPERTPELSGHGGPLVLPSIGAVVSDPVAYLPPVPRPAQRPRSLAEPCGGLRVPDRRCQPLLAPLRRPSSATSAQTVTEPTQAATVTTTETATTTAAATTTTEATTTTASTTSETATATVSVTVSATETTEEGQ